MSICNKPHIGNIWVSIHLKGEQYRCWVEKNSLLTKKACMLVKNVLKICGLVGKWPVDQ